MIILIHVLMLKMIKENNVAQLFEFGLYSNPSAVR